MSVKEKNVQISEALFDDIVDFLFLRIKPEQPLQEKYREQLNRISAALLKKQDKLMCHNAYSVMVSTKNQEELERAKFNYQYHKRE